MNKYRMEWIQEWCQDNGWTDPFQESKEYWAFPPHAVMPLPIPTQALHGIKRQKGISPIERVCLGSVWAVSAIAAMTGFFLENPMPLVLAFGFSALIFAGMDDD